MKDWKEQLAEAKDWQLYNKFAQIFKELEILQNRLDKIEDVVIMLQGKK